MAESHVFVIFGATGDLARRKLLPAVYESMQRGATSGPTALLGVSSSDVGDEAYRRFAREALEAAGFADTASWCDDWVYFQQIRREE